MDTHQANRIAIGPCAKAIRLALLNLGMRRCSLSFIYRQAEAPVRGQRLSWYCAFWRWFGALWKANRAGAEFLFEDFCGRVEALRKSGDAATPAGDGEWQASVFECLDAHTDALKEAVAESDMSRIIETAARATTCYRRLIALAHARTKRAKAA
jgi:hypothetical protein